MFKNFLVGFVLLCLLAGVVLFAYGKRVVNRMSSPQTDAYVTDSTIIPSNLNWIDFTPTTNKFSVKLPAMPQQGKDRLTDVKTKEQKDYEMYVSKNNDTVFMVSVISFTQSNQDKTEDAILNDVIQDMVASNPANKLENVRHGLIDGHKDVDFVINNDNYVLAGRAIIANKQLYVLSALANNIEATKSPEYNYFLNSFKLK